MARASKLKNSNVESLRKQIDYIINILRTNGLLIEFFPPKIDISGRKISVGWNNHKSSRAVSANSFTKIDQYLTILESNSYHLLLRDYSIVRYSFCFDGPKLVSQNLLWWPCPVSIDETLLNDLSLSEAINLLLYDSSTKDLIVMRTPVRVDYDTQNNKINHPMAHVHIQHYETRVNVETPMCFANFIRFILDTSYPSHTIEFRDWPVIDYSNGRKVKHYEYSKKEKLIIDRRR